jgi:hypothetical protein
MDMLFKTVERRPFHLMLVLHTARDPSPAEWAEYERELRRLKQLHPHDMGRVLTLVVSDGGSPNTEQRSRFQNDLFGGRPAKVALLTNSLGNPLKRGIVRALTWMNTGFRAMEPTDLEGALAYLGQADLLEEVWNELCALQLRLPPVQTLFSIAELLGRQTPSSSRIAVSV